MAEERVFAILSLVIFLENLEKWCLSVRVGERLVFDF